MSYQIDVLVSNEWSFLKQAKTESEAVEQANEIRACHSFPVRATLNEKTIYMVNA